MKKTIAVIISIAIMATCVIALSACEDADNNGLSAYELAVKNGFEGTETEWLESLKGTDGEDGVDGTNGINGLNGTDGKDNTLTVNDYYEAAVEAGYEGAMLDFIKEVLGDATVSDNKYTIAENLLSSVSIVCQFEIAYDNIFYGSGTTTTSSSGSGVIYKLDKSTGSAYIITNYHVVYAAESVSADKISRNINVYLYGGETGEQAIPATFIGGAMNYDVAVLYIENSDILKNSDAKAVEFADSNEIAVGQTAIAIGNAQGKGISATSGVISVDSENLTMTAADNVTSVTFRVMRVDCAVNKGNSGGGLKEYIDTFESQPMAQGGCIWDWVDQSFREIDENGKWYWTYGGDYGPKNIPSFGNFCCNGLVNALREPHPHLLEVKKQYQYIKSKLVNEKNLEIEIKNWYDFTNTNEYKMAWNITADNGEILYSGEENISCEPHEIALFKFGAKKLPKNIKEAYLNISWLSKETKGMIPCNHEVAYDQFVINVNKNYKENIDYANDNISFEIDKETGSLVSYKCDGKEMLSSPVTLSLFRPTTDNDNRERIFGTKAWEKAGLESISQKCVNIKTTKNKTTAEIDILNSRNQVIGKSSVVYSKGKNGKLDIKVTFKPDTATVKSLARIGLAFTMPYEYKSVTYLGRGNHENYSDRNASGIIGIWNTDAERMFHYYVRPQATGNRTDVRWAEFYNENGMGLRCTSDKAFQFSVIPFEDKNVNEAEHVNELQRTGIVTVHLDAFQSGVGTATCGPGVLPQYMVPLEKVTFEFSIQSIYKKHIPLLSE